MPRASRFVQPVPSNCSSTTHAAQPDASPLQLVPEDAVLLDEVLDDLLLVAVDPSSDDRLRYCQAQLQQLAVNPRRTPERIGVAHPPNQISELRPDRRPTASASTLPRPVAPEPLPVPADHGLWPHHPQRITHAITEPRQHHPEDPVHSPEPWPRGAPSNRRVAAEARGSPVPTPGACEPWIAGSQ